MKKTKQGIVTADIPGVVIIEGSSLVFKCIQGLNFEHSVCWRREEGGREKQREEKRERKREGERDHQSNETG